MKTNNQLQFQPHTHHEHHLVKLTFFFLLFSLLRVLQSDKIKSINVYFHMFSYEVSSGEPSRPDSRGKKGFIVNFFLKCRIRQIENSF